RSMFPLIVPRPLWDRANALDSIGYTGPAIVGPALAGALTAARGAELALLVSAVMFVAAAAVLIGVAEPQTDPDLSEPVFPAALGALRYVLRNRSLRGIAAAISVANLGQAALTVGLRVLVVDRLHGGPAVVGQLWAAQGVAGVVGSLLVGKLDTKGRSVISSPGRWWAEQWGLRSWRGPAAGGSYWPPWSSWVLSWAP